MRGTLVLAAATVFGAATACGGSSSSGAAAPPPASFTCNIGNLSGAWRAHYVETNGTCGSISDETVIAGSPAPSSNCTVQTAQVSSDRCKAEWAFTCPTTDGQGTVSWVVVLDQVSDSELKGSGTVQATDPALPPPDTCRSTYDITVTKL